MYPIAYGTQLVSFADMRRRYEKMMHPEFARRLFAWLPTQGGRIGIGSGHRSTATQMRLWLSNPRRFARPGNSFHEEHRWASGIIGYAAVDLVHVSGPGRQHRSPTFAECESAKHFGLHVFISGEPWHMQLIETRSASAWKRAGRPDPKMINLPGTVTPPPTPDPIVPSFPITPKPPAPSPGEDDIVTKLPTLRKGSTGEHVSIMQALLRHHGAGITVDGQFGPQTEQIVRYVQGTEGLVQDGICGPQTWSALLKVL